MKQPVKGKIVFITGSSRGIGRQLAWKLLSEGATVVLNGRNKDRLEKTRMEFEAHGHHCLAISGDITNYEECCRMISDIISIHQRLDVLVTNASITMEAKFDDVDFLSLTKVIESNLYGTLAPVKAALPSLKKSKGSLILISSLAGLHGLPGFSAYCMGKMPLTALWQSLRIENKNTGIHFGLVMVGFTRNDPDKTLMDAQGNTVLMPPRPAGLQQTQEKVANSLFKVIITRRKKIVLSPIGKFMAVVSRISPRLLYWIIGRFFD